MVEADGTRDLPGAVLVVPQRDEFCLADVLRVTGVMKAVNADLNGAVVLQRVDLERVGNESPLNFAGADVVLDGVEKRLLADGEARFVVIELEAILDQRPERLEVAGVVSVEEFCVERADGREES